MGKKKMGTVDTEKVMMEEMKKERGLHQRMGDREEEEVEEVDGTGTLRG